MIFANLLLEEQRFGHAVKLIESRSQIVLNEMWPRLATGGVGLNERRDAVEIERLLGFDIVRKLTVMTEGIITNVDENLVTLKGAHDELRAVMKRRYPTKGFLRFEPFADANAPQAESVASGE